MWKARSDFALSLEDFAVREISWGNKADGIARICKSLRISPDSALFVDDNYGELLQVSEAMSTIHTLHAQEDAETTARAVEMYPGVFRWNNSMSSRFRKEDLASNSKRAEIRRSSRDENSYWRELGISIELHYDVVSRFTRSVELIRKTNQFNLSLGRSDEATVVTYLDDPRKCVATVVLNDRLSDSGVICVVLAKLEGSVLFVEELNLSCRSLGRGVEDLVIFSCLQNMEIAQICTEIRFRVTLGPRNQPALLWLRKVIESHDFDGDEASIPANCVLSFTPPSGVTIKKGKVNDQSKH